MSLKTVNRRRRNIVGFKLKTVQGKPDDFKSMAEIMERRYGNETDWPMPDLIIIDGGKGQLNAALPLIRAVGVTDVPVISLAKRIEEAFCGRSVGKYHIISSFAGIAVIATNS